MKSDIAYYLLIIYTLALCKPLVPFVQDKIAHTLWKTEHLATVHHHHGDHHAEHEANSESHEESNKNSQNIKTTESVSMHLIVEINASHPLVYNASPKLDFRKYDASSLSLKKPYPPPRFV